MNDQLNILFKIHSFESNKRATKQVTSPKFISLLTQAKHMTQLLRANNERVEYVLASYSNFCTCNQSLQLAAKWEGIICDFFFFEVKHAKISDRNPSFCTMCHLVSILSINHVQTFEVKINAFFCLEPTTQQQATTPTSTAAKMLQHLYKAISMA